MRRSLIVAIALSVLAGGAWSIAQTATDDGVIGPKNRIQPSGRKLDPLGKLTTLGNLPTGAALTPDGRFLWTTSAGRGPNDVRILRVKPSLRCKRRAAKSRVKRRAALRRHRRCLKRRARQVGRVVQTIPMPGLSGGIAMAPEGWTAYVSGTPETPHEDQTSPPDTPGKEGDVIHVLRYDPRSGKASRDGVIEVPPPSGSPTPQDFPPRTDLAPQSWPQGLAVSRDGKTLLAALNLADRAAVIDTTTRDARYAETGSFPYGAAIDGNRGFVSNEADGTVSVIDIRTAEKIKDITVGPHLSHPEGIAIDPRTQRAYVAVTHQDLIAVIDTEKLKVERTLSVGRPEGIGTAPVDVSVTPDGCFLMSANSGEDAVAVFALPDERGRTCRNDAKRKKRRPAAKRAEAILTREGRRGVELAESNAEEAAEVLGEESEEEAEEAKARRPAVRLPEAFSLIGRVPVASYPTAVEATAGHGKLVWVSAKGLGVGPNPNGPNPLDPRDSDDAINSFQYLPSQTFGRSGIAAFPTNAKLRKLTPRASRQIRPVNDEPPPPGTPIAAPGKGQKIEHVFYVVRENRTYDQVLGDDSRGDGDPKLTLFGDRITPNAHALARRFPLLDHVYANSEASIDGHFWTSAAAVSDYVVRAWSANYGGRKRPYDFGVYAVTWPSQRFLFDRAEKQGISYFNYGEAIAGMVYQFPDKDRGSEELQEILAKQDNSDLNAPATPGGCFPNVASSGGIDEVLSLGPLPDIEVYDSSLPAGAPPGSLSRFDCFKQRFEQQVSAGNVPAFNYMTFANDHTAGTRPGRRTPNAMIAENDYALGQIVDLISHSPIWDKSLILVIEDDSQDGADHVDAHRIPAFAISCYAKRGAVVHTRYDFLSFIRTLEIVVGMKPLNLFDATAVPMYGAFDPEPSNCEPYDAAAPNIDLTERNTAATPNARLSDRLDIGKTDRTPQRYLDYILWQFVHGKDSQPPPPGPNASGLDEAAWKRAGKPAPRAP